MQKVEIQSKTITGLTTRTTNQNEMSPSTAKLGALWQTFDKKVPVDYQKGERVYGVYFDYESDHTGEFSVLAGFDGNGSSLEKVTIDSGQYLRFDATAKSADDTGRIQAVIETWGLIWQYFSDKPKYERAYKTDFEFYKDPTHIEIYISINS